jgi:sigma-B regulation protein RsbU (phosphoserine phosphatase)
MQLRWKFFLILLLFSLTPLLAVTAITDYNRRSLSRTLPEHASRNLGEIVQQELQQTATAYAVELQKSLAAAEATTLLLAQAVEKALAREPDGKAKTYLLDDFSRPETAPPDLAQSPLYARQTGDRRQPLAVSFEHPAFLLPAGLSPNQARRDMALLTASVPAFNEALSRQAGYFFRLLVTLDTGLTMIFPGHEAPAAAFDPMAGRRRLIGGVGPALFWTAPFSDEATGQAVLSCLMGFPQAGRGRTGLIALDFRLNAALEETHVPFPFLKAARVVLVEPMTDPATRLPGLRILAERGSGTFPAGRETEGWLESSTPAAQRPMIQALKSKSAGVFHLPYHGQEALWVHSAPVKGHALVMIVPESAIAAQAADLNQNVRDLVRSERRLTLAAVLAAILAVALAALIGSRSSLTMLTDLVSAAGRLAGGDFSIRLDKRFKDERDMVCDCFNDMVPKLEQYIQLKQVMGLAQEVQRSLLPRESPQVPGLDIAGDSLYCDETGGDYYDFFEIGPTRFAVIVGDVSGHGVPSALLMATARAFVRLRASIPSPAAGFIGDINRHISRDTALTGQFMTLFYAEFDHREKSVDWVRAGHEPALLYDPASDGFEELVGVGPALGLDPDFEYRQSTKKLSPGQILVIGTDGIWEARNESGEMLGKEALRQIVRAHQDETAKNIVEAVITRVSRFQGGRAQEDDITLVVVKVEESGQEGG